MNIDMIDLVLRVASKSVGACESPPNSNAGPYVERVLKRVGLEKGQPWCAADLADTGVCALGKLWPLPLTGGCQVLYEFGVAHKIVFEAPQRGDVFVIWHPELKRFGHTGFVRGDHGETHEGNTSGAGSREGWLVAERTRVFKPEDRFIRWINLFVVT